MFKGRKINFLNVYSSSSETDTLQVSYFCLEGCTPLPFFRKISDTMSDTLILLQQVILATEAFMLWNSYSLLLIQLQLEEFRGTFPSIHKTISIQEKSNQNCGLLVPLTGFFLLSNRLTKHQWVYSLLKSMKKCFHFPTDFWSQFTASLQNNSPALVRGAMAFDSAVPSLVWMS